MVSALGYVTVDLPMDEREREREREDPSVSDFFSFFLFFPFSIEKLALEMVCPGTGEGIEGICAWDSRKNIEIYVVA